MPVRGQQGTTPHAGLAADRVLITRAAATDQVADVLRARIVQGYFPPGTRLPEEVIRQALGVSRGTLRESFRLLAQERLLVHELNRGVFVSTLTVADLLDIFRVRRIVEDAALSRLSAHSGLEAAKTALERCERHAAGGAWRAYADADADFHLALVSAAGSSRLNGLVRGVLGELQLAFPASGDLVCLRQRQLGQNREMWRHLAAGDTGAGRKVLALSLDEYERALIDGCPAAGGTS
ncbi:GntR family transcriptional regulator [Streptomyces sp. NPDC047117]|uniref:GntR family transcriptional regulator n=1 Tax=Streptomyces sp. NPDC047117 TaxID=3155379 RepID=UPI0033C4AF43